MKRARNPRADAHDVRNARPVPALHRVAAHAETRLVQAEPSISERMLLEARFRERQGRLLRAEAGVLVACVLGIGLVVAAKQSAPNVFGAATAIFVFGTFASLLRVWHTARRHWRCPDCDARWQTQDSLASLQWNHCPDCGAALRAHPKRRERERAAFTEFALARDTPETLRERFERRRRRAFVASGIAVAAALVALVWGAQHAPGEVFEQAVTAFATGVVIATMVWSARCPRCRSGLVGARRHCQRCGLQLGEAP